jgi:ATP-dependent exoDNAse (exonuclease V) beta subunit
MSHSGQHTPPGDLDARRRSVAETGQSFVVEASAGTGKTSTLIDRILHLVLESGPGGVALPLSRICAITFTEKAAGEMKVRLRQELEKVLLNPGAPPERLDRAREGLSDIETASISTFHSFAVSLLKERPIEAGLDPHFVALDDMRSELFFREVWEPWINRALTDRVPVLEKALRAGFSLDKLFDLAGKMRQHWLQVRDLDSDPPPSGQDLQAQIESFEREGRALMQLLIQPGDKLAPFLEQALDWLGHPEEAGGDLAKPGSAGAAANWTGGKETVKAARQLVRSIVEYRQIYRGLPAQRLLHEIVCWIKDAFMLGEWEIRKREGGLLDFDDQLRLARDLLLKNQSVRRDFQQQFQTLLVDEFQDTDPIQWEIVLLLSAADVEGKGLAKLAPAPGRLFIVGDPKQSIYRFRHADIETYLGIVEAEQLQSLGLNRLELTTNFRSVPAILRFVDAAFENAMVAGQYQPKYLPFGNHGHREPGLAGPSVYLFGERAGEPDSKRRAAEIAATESRRIARLILEIKGSREWCVHDRGERGGSGWRSPQYGDIAVLLPMLTHAYALEEELRDHGIPYVLEGGKFYYARSEVASAILVLRALANPNDAVALYGSLRSIFFGMSDEDLLRAHIGGISMDYREVVPRNSPLFRPFEILRTLHRLRHARPASETFEILLQETGAREVLAVRGFQSLANLHKLGRTLRSYQNNLTFSRVVDLLGTIDEEGLAESESRLMEERSDAVRVMTIHKAKGLDFPILIAAALGMAKASRGKDVLVDRFGRKIFALNLGSADSGLRTFHWKQLAEEEKKRDEAELVRLLYVALTRAKDHLVLSTHTAGCRKLEGSELCVPDVEGTRLLPLDSFLEDCYAGKNHLAQLIDAAGLDIEPEAVRKAGPHVPVNWEAAVLKEYGELRDLIAKTPVSGDIKAAGRIAGSTEPEDRSGEARESEAAANRSVRLGIAFHEAMERIDILESRQMTELVREIAARHKIDSGSTTLLEAMLRATVSSELLGQARAAIRAGRKVVRELPFVRPLGPGSLEEGKIDLLIEQENGWVLVDYKTDWVSDEKESAEEFFHNKYSSQIGAYIKALRSFSINVQAAYLLLARTGEAIQLV